MKITSAMVAALLLASTAAGAQEPEESLAIVEAPMADEALADARGGFELNGFLIDFVLRTSVIIDGAADLAGNLTGPVEFAFDPTADSLIINNSLDGVSIERVVALDIIVHNFSATVSAASAASAGIDIPVSYIGLSGF